MSARNSVFTSMYLCESFDAKINTVKGLMNKICTNDNLSATFTLVVQVKYLVVDKIEHFDCFLFLQNNNRTKLMFRFEVPDSNENQEQSIFGINRIIEFDNYSFPNKGSYLWKLYVAPKQEVGDKYKSEEDIDIAELLNDFEKNNYLENVTDLFVE